MTVYRDDDIDRRLRSAIGGALRVVGSDPPVRSRDVVGSAPERRLHWVVAVAGTIALVAASAAVGYRVHHTSQPVLGLAPTPSSAPGRSSNTPSGSMQQQIGSGPVLHAGPGIGTQSPGPQPSATPLPLRCTSGANGGATDTGVTAAQITLGATVIETGTLAGMFGEARYGMRAAVDEVNRDGGICGRRVVVRTVDDGGDGTRGKQAIDDFIASRQIFALAGVPSFDGLAAAYMAGDLSRAGIPVIGNDGMLWSYTSSSLVWPVSPTAATAMRIAAQDAAQRHAHTFAFVYAPSARGSAGAFPAQVQREGGQLDPACIVVLDPSSSDYSSQAYQFWKNCGPGRPDGGVDFVALDIPGPVTLHTWMSSLPTPYLGIRADGSGKGAATAGFPAGDDFVAECGSQCAGVRVWTSVYPNASPFDSAPAMQAYRSSLQAECANCDPRNLNTLAAYEGMRLTLRALQATGPLLTRTALLRTLGTLRFEDPGLLLPISFDGTTQAGAEAMVALTEDGAGEQNGQYTYQQVGGPYTDPCPGCADSP